MKILYLTDLYYEAKGRKYYEEDLYITSILKNKFNLVLCHPLNSKSFEEDVDLIIFRNTGSVIGYKEEYKKFINRIKTKNIQTFNEFNGKADMQGKQYLLELTKANYPVIPTFNSQKDLSSLHDVEEYVIKPLDGADSIGLEYVTKKELIEKELSDKMLIQPRIDFEYEVSFYYINDKFEYALYAPNKEKRWELEQYKPTKEDLEFAEKFIKWNTIKKGIQRVDACRTKDGKLLLVELEDLNPYLSLSSLDEETKNQFMEDFIKTIQSYDD
ncbi:MAG: hypothetical protein IJI98_10475 [Methanosphaera sp.]|nr:hypothetical protein [Methanosphaera sp.]